MKMGDQKRNEAVLRNLAEELLSPDECHAFKQVIHHFRVSHSVTTLCQQLKSIINSTQKLLLLVELSSRIPKSLQEDFYRLCVLQFPNYDSYLRIFTNGNSPNEMSQTVAQDPSGRFRIVSHGSEKKMMIKQNNQKQTYELRSQPGTSVTSGVYSNASDSDDGDDQIDTLNNNNNANQGRATPVHLEGKKNVHKVFLHRHNDGSLGLGIKGGKEFGTDIVINVVEEGGPAAKQGLKVGDKILEVNGHTIQGLTHAEAVLTVRNAWNLIILIERPTDKQTQPIDFVDYGRSFLPIQELELIVYPSTTGRLGCVTQRLTNDTLIVKTVEPNSAAFKAGLVSNDRIVMVDNINVRELSEKQIVMLTKAKRLVLKVTRDISLKGDTADGYILSKGYKVIKTPEKPQQMNYFNHIEPKPRRDTSAESKQSSHHSAHFSNGYTQENLRPNSAPATQQYLGTPEHLVYGNKLITDTNWVLSSKPNRVHRYTQKKDAIHHRESYPMHVRNASEGRQVMSRSRYGNQGRDYGTQNGGVSRYVRSRSYSPHRNALTVNRIHQDDHMIQAIQLGLEKRQRAIRLSSYQMPDPADYEWEID